MQNQKNFRNETQNFHVQQIIANFNLIANKSEIISNDAYQNTIESIDVLNMCTDSKALHSVYEYLIHSLNIIAEYNNLSESQKSNYNFIMYQIRNCINVRNQFAHSF